MLADVFLRFFLASSLFYYFDIWFINYIRHDVYWCAKLIFEQIFILFFPSCLCCILDGQMHELLGNLDNLG